MTEEIEFKSLDEFVENIKPLKRVVVFGSRDFNHSHIDKPTYRNHGGLLGRNVSYLLSKKGVSVIDLGASFDMGKYRSPILDKISEVEHKYFLRGYGRHPMFSGYDIRLINSVYSFAEDDEECVRKILKNSASLWIPGYLDGQNSGEAKELVKHTLPGKTGVLLPHDNYHLVPGGSKQVAEILEHGEHYSLILEKNMGLDSINDSLIWG